MTFPAAVPGVIRATAALPAAGAPAAGHSAAPTASASCLRVQTLTFSKARQAGELYHWTLAGTRACPADHQPACAAAMRAPRRVAAVAHSAAMGSSSAL